MFMHALGRLRIITIAQFELIKQNVYGSGGREELIMGGLCFILQELFNNICMLTNCLFVILKLFLFNVLENI